MHAKRKNNKGSIRDLPFIALAMLAFGMFVLIGFKLTSEYNDQVQAISFFNADSRAATQELTNHYTGAIDNSFLFFSFGLAMVSLILASLVRVHPIFIPFFFIVWVIMIFVSGIASNIYQDTAANAAISAEANQLTFIPLLLEGLPFFIGVLGMILMVIMYKNWSDSQ